MGARGHLQADPPLLKRALASVGGATLNSETVRGGAGAGPAAQTVTLEPGSQKALPPPPVAERGLATRWPKGVSGNPKGRVPGSINNTTRIANELLKAKAHKAAEKLLGHLDDPNPWIAQNAARIVLERTVGAEQAEPQDTDWLRYATDGELRTIERTMKRCIKRRAAGLDAAGTALSPAADAPPDELVIDVPATVVPE